MEENENTLTPGDYLSIINRRKWAFIIPFMIILICSALTAILLPPVYKSTGTILIEQREIPSIYVTSSMTTYAEQRIQSIKQRVLTSSQLQSLIKQFNLYPKLKKKKTIDEIIQKMRKDIILTPVTVDVSDRRSGRTAMATIAFTLSYQGKNPEKVQKVASTIITLFLKEDLKVRKEQASSTHEFLKDESERLRLQLNEYDKKLAAFKKKYANYLPDMFQMNMQILNNINRDIELAKGNLSSLKAKKEELEEQLNNTPVDLQSAMAQREQKDEDEKRLEILKINLINLKTKFSPLYPDVKNLEKEIKALSKKIKFKKEKRKKTHTDEKDMMKNPAYVTLSSRLSGVELDIESLKKKIKSLEKQADVYNKRLARAPAVEEKYNTIISERNNINAKYNEMLAKMMDAKVAQELESQQKDERLSLVEPAMLPEKPFKPNRLAILIIGIVLGLGAGVGCAAFMEFSDTSFWDAESLSKATGFPVLTTVKIIVTRDDRKKRIRMNIIKIVAILILTAVGLILFNNYIMNLNVLWAKVMRRIG